MPQLNPGWQLSLQMAAVLIVVHVGCRVLDRRRHRPVVAVTGAFAREFTVIMLLLGLWQYVGAYVHNSAAGAMARGREIASLQNALHLPSEQAVQRAILAVPHLSTLADLYYAYVHLNGTAVFVVWVWWRHRDVYPRVRFVIIFSTLACLLIQTVPVAPPRLLPGLGFVDTALRDGQSVYGQFGSGMTDQLSAMPSVHVAWAVIVGVYVWRCAPHRFGWIGPLHTTITVLVVVGTANHWWLDGIVAAALVGLGMLLRYAYERIRDRAHGPVDVRRSPVALPAVGPVIPAGRTAPTDYSDARASQRPRVSPWVARDGTGD